MEEPSEKSSDLWAGLALAALGVYIIVQAGRWEYLGPDGPGPGFFPMWYGSLMVALSLVLVARTALKPPTREAQAAMNWKEIARALTCWVAFVACVALMNVLGFAVSFALLTWFIVAYMARRPHREAAAIAIAGSAVFYGIFSYLLDLSLPAGYLF